MASNCEIQPPIQIWKYYEDSKYFRIIADVPWYINDTTS